MIHTAVQVFVGQARNLLMYVEEARCGRGVALDGLV